MYYDRVDRLQSEFTRSLSPLVVQTGYFKGLKYPSAYSYGSALAPKIVGSYEEELHPYFERLLQKPYQEIIIIGAAEGFYTANFALKKPGVKIYSFELHQEATEFCKKLVQYNSISNEINYKDECNEKELIHLHPDNAFIFCDAEGSENRIFTTMTLPFFKTSNLIIELHDFIEPGTRERMIDLFKTTHKISVVKTHRRNLRNYSAILGRYSRDIQKAAVDEARPCPMEWLVLEHL